MAVLRESGIFCGAGVYTANEIWHCAGTSSLLLSRFNILHYSRPFTESY